MYNRRLKTDMHIEIEKPMTNDMSYIWARIWTCEGFSRVCHLSHLFPVLFIHLCGDGKTQSH